MDLLAAARAVLEEGPICNPCLGRPFADRSHGLTNEERGRALRVAVALADDDPYQPAERDCWICEDVTQSFDAWADRVVEAFDGYTFETYQVGTRVPPLYEENEQLLRELARLPAEAGEPLRREVNREVGKRVGQALGREANFDRPDVLAILDLEAGLVEPQINAAFIYGRYRKLERGLPQTEWPCRECGGSGRRDGASCGHCDGTGYLYEDSVEGLVAPVVRETMDGTDATFHGAGREDVDARMVGTGRPFVVEVAHPTDRFPDVAALEERINERTAGRVEVEGLRLATHEMVERVKALSAHKTYRAAVEFDSAVAEADLEGALETLDGTTIEQDTPQRVAHRRAAKTRTRTVYDITGILDSPTTATLEVRGEGGLYVKELVHGDGGRTQPSLAGLLDVGATVTALDVVAVEAEESQFADPAYLRDVPAG